MKKDKRNKRKKRLQRKKRNLRHHKTRNPKVNKPSKNDSMEAVSDVQIKRYKYITYDMEKKEAFDKVLGQDSRRLLTAKHLEYMKETVKEHKYCLASNKYSAEQKRDMLLRTFKDKFDKCEMTKYFMEELDIPKESKDFFLHNFKDLFEEFLGLKRYKEYKFDSIFPVRLLWDGKNYKINHRNDTFILDCETVIIIDKWAFAYNHFEEVSQWNNGTFRIFQYEADTNDLIDHPTATIDHYLLFNHHFNDGVLFANDLARFVEFQFSDIVGENHDYSDY